MPCYSPFTVGYARAVNPTGKKSLCFRQKDSDPELASFKVPCGRCIGCRLEYAKQWAVRCVHEATMHERNCFITLTYAPEHLLSDSLQHSDFQTFMRRLRKVYGKSIGVFMCGEYGEQFGRPHFHACLFGVDFSETNDRYGAPINPRTYYRVNAQGDKIYQSSELDKIWQFGKTEIGSLTFESAGYCARYITKKLNKEDPKYEHKIQEYAKMSSRHAIGKKWIEKYYLDVFNYGELIIRGGIKTTIPRYYKKWIEKHHPDLYLNYKFKNWGFDETPEYKLDNTKERLKVKRIVQTAKIQQLKRPLDTER